MRRFNMEDKIREIIRELGEDPSREGLLKTPLRVSAALRYLTKGYNEDPKKIINGAVFSADQKDMVILKNIDFFSMCEHHLLPFFGKCHVAYIPSGKILGLSKLARLIDIFARRLQVQERLTQQIAKTIQEALSPAGVAVIMEAQHLCMLMRGVERQNSVAITSSMIGVFEEKNATRSELLALIRGNACA